MQIAQKQVLVRQSGRPAISRRSVVVTRAALELKSPPYALDALEPHMSKQTLEFHWGGLVLDHRKIGSTCGCAWFRSSRVACICTYTAGVEA